MVDSPNFSNLNNFNYYAWDPELPENVTFAEYIWIDGTGQGLRSKTKIIYDKKVKSVDDLPWWTYDGSSTQQASTQNSEIYIKPVYMTKDPLRKKHGILVLCETYLADQQTPARYNFRYITKKIMDEAKDEKPWFGMEQEFFLFQRKGTTVEWPLGFPLGNYPTPQGRYYCSIGDNNAFGRACVEAGVRCCVAAGLNISGINAEVAPSQWEYQVGPCDGISAADQQWMSRYILQRVGEEFGCTFNIDPKPILGDWNGSGCHMNFSTETTRKDGGLDYIKQHCLKVLSEKHKQHIFLYGEGNELRLTGAHETSSIARFDYGEGNRGRSIRIPIPTMQNKKGYFEDRRPASNIDPYLATGIIVDTVCLKSKYCEEMIKAYKDSMENNF